MATFFSSSSTSSRVGSVTDLDGYTFPASDYYSAPSYYLNSNHDEFGFDPPSSTSAYPTYESTYSPESESETAALSSWPGLGTEDEAKRQLQTKLALQQPNLPANLTLSKIQTANLPPDSNVVSRFGQFTPPRSNSTSSVEVIKQESGLSPKSISVPQRKKSKAQLNESTPSSAMPKVPRKRKASRKSIASPTDSADTPGGDKRKMSLEKNRVAAAKCRVNKKEKTEQMQRDAHDMSMQNNLLKDNIMHMKAEIQHINALLLTHAHCEGCNDPNEVNKHLRDMGNDYFSHQSTQQFSYPAVADQMHRVDHEAMMQDGYFASAAMDQDPATLSNPPLPEYNQPAEFVLQTPQPAD